MGADKKVSGPVDVLAKPVHGAPKPKNVPSDMVAMPPMACGLKVGDKVTFTNDYGVVFEGRTVRGFTSEVTSWGACVYIEPSSAWWMPVKPSALANVGSAS